MISSWRSPAFPVASGESLAIRTCRRASVLWGRRNSHGTLSIFPRVPSRIRSVPSSNGVDVPIHATLRGTGCAVEGRRAGSGDPIARHGAVRRASEIRRFAHTERPGLSGCAPHARSDWSIGSFQGSRGPPTVGTGQGRTSRSRAGRPERVCRVSPPPLHRPTRERACSRSLPAFRRCGTDGSSDRGGPAAPVPARASGLRRWPGDAPS